MNTSKILIRMSLTLGVITLIGLLFSALALMDIYNNNEPNLNMEWNIVRISFLVCLMFVAISTITILKIRKK
jgi:hypothetical protein